MALTTGSDRRGPTTGRRALLAGRCYLPSSLAISIAGLREQTDLIRYTPGPRECKTPIYNRARQAEAAKAAEVGWVGKAARVGTADEQAARTIRVCPG